jgi:hypothetical protein
MGAFALLTNVEQLDWKQMKWELQFVGRLDAVMAFGLGVGYAIMGIWLYIARKQVN